MSKSVKENFNFVEEEIKIFNYWKKHDIFKKSLEYVFI